MSCGVCGDPAICRDHGCQEEAYEVHLAEQEAAYHRAMDLLQYREQMWPKAPERPTIIVQVSERYL